MSLKGKAKEVLAIIEKGGFFNTNGEWVDISQEIEFSLKHTLTYLPDSFPTLDLGKGNASCKAKITVTDETTQIATSRCFSEGYQNLVLLNFASAKNPGGGFINGAKAQEEDLARCSTLYQCQLSQPHYYEANRKQDSMLYTDHIIYSPQVPWFRTRSRDNPGKVFTASVITAPAPNANQALRKGESQQAIEQALIKRAGKVLAVARENGHRNLILGAWGCGVFGNDPRMVAKAFHQWLISKEFSSSFDNVVFAVYDPSKTKGIYTVFAEAFNHFSPPL